ncbi:MAG: ABC transporter permease [Lachnospiraceae bacterium]|nr:ABC transporter permease [Lachnospiraceae bacterium]
MVLFMKKKNDTIKVACLSVLISLIAGMAVILILGKNPLSAYFNLLQGCGLAPKGKYAAGKSMLTDISSFIDYWTPMIFAALSCAAAMKAGLFNIGISGQMLTAGFICSITIGYSSLSAGVAKPLVIIVGALCGTLVGALIGFLKARFNINEVVSSIMLNYIGSYVYSFFIKTNYIDTISRQSRAVSEASRLSLHQIRIGGFTYDIPLGFVLAIIAAFLLKFIFDRTVLGYELKAVGMNKTAAGYAGIRVNKSIVVSMSISGLLAGIAGVTYYLGYFASIQPRVLVSTGYDAIAVCLLGNSNPLGILASSFLVQIIGKGSAYMSSQAGLESEIAGVITGLILLFSACNRYILEWLGRRRENLVKGGEENV